MEPGECFVGIDVSKATLDVATRPAATPWTEAHTEAGITALVARLQSLKPTLIVLEAAWSCRWRARWGPRSSRWRS